MKALAARGRAALERTWSAAALAAALERERLVSMISRRSAPSSTSMRCSVAVEETARATRRRPRLRTTRGPDSRDACRRRVDIAGTRTDRPLARRPRGVQPRARRPEHRCHFRRRAGTGARFVGRRHRILAPPRDESRVGTPIVVLDQLSVSSRCSRVEPVEWTSTRLTRRDGRARVGLAFETARLLERTGPAPATGLAVQRGRSLTRETSSSRSSSSGSARPGAKLLDADAADCFLFDEQRRVLAVRRGARARPASSSGSSSPPTEARAGRRSPRERPLIDDRLPGSSSEPGPHRRLRRLRGRAVAPMAGAREVRGVLGVGRRGERHATSRRPTPTSWRRSPASRRSRCATPRASRRAHRQARVQLGFLPDRLRARAAALASATLDAVAQAAGGSARRSASPPC